MKLIRLLSGVLLSWCLGCITLAHAFEQTQGFDCIVTPSQTVNLGSPVPGQLVEVLVDRSERVTAGQIVASLDSRLENASLAIATHRAETNTEMNLRKDAFNTDLKTEKRLTSLEASDVASKHERDRARRDAKLAGWRVQQARDDLITYQLEKVRAEVNLDRRRIRSPIDGLVVARLHEPGEYIDSQPILKIVKLDPLYVEAILPMRLFGQVRAGMTASVYSEHSDDQALDATVDVVDPMGDAGSGTFGARLLLSNPEGDIPAGVKCRVQLNEAQTTPAN